MSVTRSVLVFATSLLAVPVAYLVKTVESLQSEFALLACGVGAFFTFFFLTYLAVSKAGEPTDPFFYVLAIGMMSSVFDIIIGLENSGYISGLMSSYLKDGEPYLQTAHGTMICLWDGFGHYAMYIMILTSMAYHRHFHLIGLYWAGSIGHSMLVFIPGNIIGQHDIHLSFLLNIPYILFPFWSAARFLRERKMLATKTRNASNPQYGHSILKRPSDIFFTLCLCFFIGIAVFRGLAVLGPNKPLFNTYIKHYEPYLMDPDAYPKMQMLVYMFYFVPFYILATCELLWPSPVDHWLTDWSVIHAGAAAQAQISYIGGSFHHLTMPPFRIPSDACFQLPFWILNLSLLLIPQLFAWHRLRRQISDKKSKYN